MNRYSTYFGSVLRKEKTTSVSNFHLDKELILAIASNHSKEVLPFVILVSEKTRVVVVLRVRSVINTYLGSYSTHTFACFTNKTSTYNDSIEKRNKVIKTTKLNGTAEK